jgi:hypothetical protein
MFIHFLMAAFFGALYELCALTMNISAYGFHSLAVYATLFYLLVGGIIFPVVGLGLFGKKEGKWTWFELLVTHHLFGFFVWLLVYIFPSLTP